MAERKAVAEKKAAADRKAVAEKKAASDRKAVAEKKAAVAKNVLPARKIQTSEQKRTSRNELLKVSVYVNTGKIVGLVSVGVVLAAFLVSAMSFIVR